MKKGFTLIELLAVILILGIIALIAIPTVNNILKEARRGAFSSTLNNLNKAIEEKCTMEQIKNQTITTQYTITDGVISPSVDIKGDLPDGIITVNNNCEIAFTLSNDNFTGTKDYNSEIVINDYIIEKEIYTEELLNGTDPVLNDDLIPVIIENNGTVKKADIYEKWYSYEEKWWANAVVLTDIGKVEDDGTILEDSIESYFVWIPRYKYKLFNMGNYNSVYSSSPNGNSKTTIEVIFENKDIPVSTGTAIGQYYSHPAFQAFDTNGIWVGKFETSGTTSQLQVKPNVKPLVNLDVKTIFNSSYNYQRDNDSHMMKNTEWGAVSYLSLSNYGINDEININNNSNLRTGYSSIVHIHDESFTGAYGTNNSTTLPYNTETGYLASTTGNISGIYDMSGGSFEYVAAYIDGNLGSSGFTSLPTNSEKYFDKYSSESGVTKFNNRILGDATGEMGPFYTYNGTYSNNWLTDYAYFVDSSLQWVGRGGYYFSGFLAGQLYFDRMPGSSYSNVGFRIALAIK